MRFRDGVFWFVAIMAGLAYFNWPSSESPNVALSIDKRTEPYEAEVRAAFAELAAVCPAVTQLHVTNLRASYAGKREWLKFDSANRYGWDRHVEFKFEDDISGHTHYVLIGGADNHGLVLVKQPTADLCQLDVTLSGENYFMPL